MENNKILPIKQYSFTQEDEQYDDVNDFILTVLPLKDQLPPELLRKVYDDMREGLGTENVLCLAKDREKEVIYIFEYDLHKDVPFTSSENENGIPYLIPCINN